jgi:thiosulfate reductase cytochrome b subunit
MDMSASQLVIHPLIVRITHWINAFAMGCMIMSGWQIYNADPLFGFTFPPWATLGGWLGGAIAWHLAAMWLLVCNGLIYMIWGLVRRHFARNFLPITVSGLWRDMRDALTFRLKHTLGVYNSVQRLLYLFTLLVAMLAVLSGLALWKPVQLQILSFMFGGYEVTRRVHFLAMFCIVGFVVIHVVLVAIVPSTLWTMITGRARTHAEVKP